MSDTPRPQWFGFLAGLFLAAGLVLSAMLVTGAWLKIAESHVIAVTGSARRNVQSDLIIWNGSFSAEAGQLGEAHRALKGHLAKVEAFLHSKGATNYTVSSITIQEVKKRERDGDDAVTPPTLGYRLSQTVEWRSSTLEPVLRLDRESNELVEQGVLFTSGTPQFIYTKAAEAKIEMLADATKDARARAEQIASQGNRQIAGLRSARMGVFQITPLYSSQTSAEGHNDTTSFEKTVTAVVAATFSLK